MRSLLNILHLHSLRLQADYVEYRKNLAKALPAESTEPSAQDPEITDALRVLQGQKDKTLGSMHDNVGADIVEINQKNEVDDAIELLVQNATEEFGFAPRDVFDAIFKPRQTRDAHAQALESFDYNDLQLLAKTFRDERALSHHQSRIIAMSPCVEHLSSHDCWRLDFKSIRIAKSAAFALMEKDDQHLSEMFWRLVHFTESVSLAGCVFEAVAHRMLSGRSQSDPRPQVICMHSVDSTSSLFSLNNSSSSSSSSLVPHIPHRVPESNHPRKGVQIDLGESLDHLTLDGDDYYILNPTIDPLFDSFVISLDHAQPTAFLSVFKIKRPASAINDTDLTSHRSYDFIRKIKHRIHQLSRQANSNVDLQIKVVYYLICPSDKSVDLEPSYEWQMPDGWGRDFVDEVDDHRGDVLCLRVPIDESSTTQRLKTPLLW